MRPWEPCKVSFKVTNSSPKGLPAPFTVYCVSDSGQYVVPLGRHSFLHHNQKATPPVIATPETSRPSGRSQSVQTSAFPPDKRGNVKGAAASNWLIKSSRTHREGESRSGSLNSQKKKPFFFGNLLGGGKAKKSSTTDSPPIATDSLAGDSPRLDPPTPVTVNSASPPQPLLQDFSLTK